MTNIALLEAKCADCGHLFGHPSLGDFAYGAFVLCTTDGKHYATVDAFNDFAVRVHALVKSADTSSLWSALAALADPVAGQQFTTSAHCPNCASNNLEYWGGQKLGIASVPEASFTAAANLNSDLLAQQVALAISPVREA
jgi:Zn finger protein HypA/HybF involved in hydrogenase expression